MKINYSKSFNIIMNFREKNIEEISEKEVVDVFFSRIFLKRIKNNKPCVFGIFGNSGEGKSSASLYIQQTILDMLGEKLEDYVDDINIFTPLEYTHKINKILFDKKLKKIPFLCIQEASQVVNSKDWQNFLVRSIADINNLSRRVKPLNIIIVSQFLPDVVNTIRRSLNYYSNVRRPLGSNIKMIIKELYMDDSDIDNIKLKKRNINCLILTKNRKLKFSPSYIEIPRVRKSVWKIFTKLDFEKKQTILKKKMIEVLNEIQKDIGLPKDRILPLAQFYGNNPEQLQEIGKQTKNGFKVNKDFKLMHSLTDEEIIVFEKTLFDLLKKKGLINEKKVQYSNQEYINEDKEGDTIEFN